MDTKQQLLAVIALLGVLQAAPLFAQQSGLPPIAASGGLRPDPLEITPTPGTLRSLQFGTQIVRHNGTALVYEPGFPDPDEGIGRVAVFNRNSQGSWVRNGSIDAPGGNAAFGSEMAIFNDFALIESTTHAFLYHRIAGKWKRVQILTPPSGYTFRDLRLWNSWAFIGATSATAGAVYVYQLTTAGTLRGVQTLRSFSGNPADAFGEHVVVSNGRALVSAAGDSGNRGAAYVFELSGALFVKRQKLMAINASSSDGFATTLGISNDWMAIGAPGIRGALNPECPNSNDFGAIYVFQRINGTWRQQDTLAAGDVRGGNLPCLDLGRHVEISGPWIASTVTSFDEFGAVVYKREAGHYTPRGTAALGDDAASELYLSDGLLFVGIPMERGCQFEGCIGEAGIYDLDKSGL